MPSKNVYIRILLSRTPAGPARTVKQEQEETSSNHMLTITCTSGSVEPEKPATLLMENEERNGRETREAEEGFRFGWEIPP